MASYKAVTGVLTALQKFLELRMVGGLDSFITAPQAKILGTKEMQDEPAGNNVGIYLHRISVDPFGRNRYLPSSNGNVARQPELPINLHFMLVAWTEHGSNEGTLISWAMQQIGSSLSLDASHLAATDNYWADDEAIQIQPEEMSTEDLLRIWDGLPRPYILSVPLLAKTIRLLPVPEIEAGPAITTIATPVGNLNRGAGQ